MRPSQRFFQNLLCEYKGDTAVRTLLAWRLGLGSLIVSCTDRYAANRNPPRFIPAVRSFSREKSAMTSYERHKARRARRELRRSFKKALRRYWHGQFNRVFTYKTMFRAYRKIRLGTFWKPGMQRYSAVLSFQIHGTLDKLRAGKFRSDGFHCFTINERGHTRHIQAVNSKERNVQRCLCDNCLVPLMSEPFIYDNGATRKDKGYHFAIRRLRKRLRDHIAKHGRKGYILLFDFKNYFGSIRHDIIKAIAARRITDKRILALLFHLIDCFGEIGLGLGSQISQTLALAMADPIDHKITETMQAKRYGRYMDDGYIIHESKAFLRQCLDALRALTGWLGIRLNERKTRIVKLAHGFTILKKRFTLTKTGKIIMKICRKSVSRERRKLKKLAEMAQAGKITWKDVYQSYQSWRSYAMHGNAWNTIQKMNGFYQQCVFSGNAA